ncbi:MAG: T9SS type A sorting domain-containing protein [Candidatus Cloacimonetes bacterium]|nr:T9SS type A sorting domain-containing protein [Candidatus Cloacimonadota bacterium]
MRRLVLCLLLLLLFRTAYADRVVIVSEDFETACPLFTKTGGSFYSGNSSSSARPASYPLYANGNSAVGISGGTLYLLSSAIDTRAFTDIELTFRVAAFSMSYSDGIDAEDYLWTQVKKSDTGFADYVTLRGPTANNCYWSYTGGTGIAATAYPAKVTFQPTGSGNRTTDGYSTVKITSLPQDEFFQVRLIARNNLPNERWMIDSFSLTGIPIPLETPVLNSATAISYEGFTAHWAAVSNATNYLLQVCDNQEFSSNVMEYQLGNVSLQRMGNILPSTSYYCRVKALSLNNSSAFSSAIQIVTEAANLGTGAGTLIGDYASIPVSGIMGANAPILQSNNVLITPNILGNYDYSIQAQWCENGFDAIPTTRLVYSISSSPDEALTGTYNFAFTGLGADIGAARYRYNGIWYLVVEEDCVFLEESCTIILTLPAPKSRGIVDIALGLGDEALPATLSSFTCQLSNHNTVDLTWQTQSETNVRGFYLYRGTNASLAEAMQVSSLISGTNTSQAQMYLFTDIDLNISGTYFYWLKLEEMDGSSFVYEPISVYYTNDSVPDVPEIHLKTGIREIYPNPFNPQTTICYEIEQPATVSIYIYNLRGQKVKRLSSNHTISGSYKVIWDGKDEGSRECASGIYHVIMVSGKFKSVRKLVLSK